MLRNICLPAVLVLALGSAATASAQSIFSNQNSVTSVPTFPRPALSPFLNLLRGGDPAANLYLGVYPEYNRRYFQSAVTNYLQDNQQQRTYIDPRLNDQSDLELRDRQLPPTGHTAGFMIYNAYYNLPNQRGYIPYNPGMNRSPNLRSPR